MNVFVVAAVGCVFAPCLSRADRALHQDTRLPLTGQSAAPTPGHASTAGRLLHHHVGTTS